MFRQGRRALPGGVSDVCAVISKLSAEAQIADRLLSGKLASCSSASSAVSSTWGSRGGADAAYLRSLLRAYSSLSRSQPVTGQGRAVRDIRQVSLVLTAA